MSKEASEADVVTRLRQLLLFDETTGHRLFDHERKTISEAADLLEESAQRIAELEAERDRWKALAEMNERTLELSQKTDELREKYLEQRST